MSDVSPWFILRESPGEVGDPEIWIDEAALDNYALAGTADEIPDVKPGTSWVGTTLRLKQGLNQPAVYQLGSRRYSSHNGGQPYYVARRPD